MKKLGKLLETTTPTKEEISIADVGPELTKMFTKADRLEVTDSKTQGQANEMIAQAKTLAKDIETRRVNIYDSLYPKDSRKVMKAVNALAKKITSHIGDITGSLSQKYLEYDRLERERLVKEEAARLKEQEKLAAIEREKAEKLFIPPGSDVVLPEPAPEKPKEVSNMTVGKAGSSYKKKVKGFNLTSFAAVPDEFKLLNESMVRKVMNDPDRGLIPGIEWTETETLATRLK